MNRGEAEAETATGPIRPCRPCSVVGWFASGIASIADGSVMLRLDVPLFVGYGILSRWIGPWRSAAIFGAGWEDKETA